MAKKKVFVSYDHSEDVLYKRLLQAWSANDKFDFEFDQRSPDVAIDSTNASTIQGALTKKMLESDYLLVIVGAKTSTSKWIKWEVERAMKSDTKLKLAAVKIISSNALPTGLTASNTAIANGFTQDGTIAALDKASNNY